MVMTITITSVATIMSVVKSRPMIWGKNKIITHPSFPNHCCIMVCLPNPYDRYIYDDMEQIWVYKAPDNEVIMTHDTEKKIVVIHHGMIPYSTRPANRWISIPTDPEYDGQAFIALVVE